MSTAVRSTARGLLYGQEQMAVAQVDPPTTPLGLLLGGATSTPLPLPPTTPFLGSSGKTWSWCGPGLGGLPLVYKLVH